MFSLHGFAILLLVSVTNVNSFDWQDSLNGSIRWSHKCDWHNGDIVSVETREKDCAGKCVERSDCTRFTWSCYQTYSNTATGVCYLKSGDSVESNAIVKSDQNAICGYKPSGSGGKSVVACENAYLTLQCSSPITVLTAIFGRQDTKTCSTGYPIGAPQLQMTNCSATTAPLTAVSTACNGKTYCTLSVVSDNLGGDPCTGTAKYLTVVYECSAAVASAYVPPPDSVATVPTSRPAPTLHVTLQPTSRPVAAVSQVPNQQIPSQPAEPEITAKPKQVTKDSSPSVFEKNPWLMWVLIGSALIGIMGFCCGVRPYLIAKRNKKKIEEKMKKEKKVKNKQPKQLDVANLSVGPPKPI